jgi:hypothetical protein
MLNKDRELLNQQTENIKKSIEKEREITQTIIDNLKLKTETQFKICLQIK